MATLVVVRHCQADGNEEHRFIGHTQSHLTDVGYRQAEALASRLEGESVTRIVTSDLVRCVETVTPLTERLDIRIETDVRLREIHNGDWTGFLPEEISGRWPALWDDYVRGADVQRPSGERWADVAARVVPVAEQLLAEDGVVLVSTHSGPALIMARWASGSQVAGNVFQGRLGALHNGSVTVIGAGPRLVSFNDVGHLAALPDQRLPFAPVKRP
jgi:broad specificity phosphatase PhoE